MTTELSALCSVVKTSDVDILFSENTDSLFKAYGDVWGYLREYYSKYRTIPPVDVITKEFPDFEYEDTSGHAQYWIDKLRNEYIAGEIESIILKAGSEIKPETAESTLAGMQKRLVKLNRFAHSVKDKNIMDFDDAEQHYKDVRQRAEEMGGVPGISTGIGLIDSAIPQGLQGGDLMTIMGYPARGKSSLGTLLASNLYARGYKTLIVSMEMTAESVRDRVYTIMGSGLFRNSDLSVGVVNTDSFRDFRKQQDKDLPMVVVEGDGSPVTPNVIQSKINEYSPNVVVLDYLQLLHDNGLTPDMTNRIRQLSMELKQLSMATQIPFIVIASATPIDNSKVTGPPSELAIAWSKQISYDSSVVLAIHKMDDTNIFEILMTKNRWGPLAAGFLQWDVDAGRVKELFDLPTI